MTNLKSIIPLIDVEQVFEEVLEGSDACYSCPNFNRDGHEDPRLGECTNMAADECPEVERLLVEISQETLPALLTKGLVSQVREEAA